MIRFDVQDEVSPLRHVVMGTGRGYHRDPARVEVVNSTQQHTVDTTGHPDEAWVTRDFDAFRAALRSAGVTVHEPGLAADSVQDQTCPRDISFVIGGTFVRAGMRTPGRVEEIDAIAHILDGCDGPRVTVPKGVVLEGGDVIVHGDHVFVGAGQRSDPEGTEFLRAVFGDTHSIVPLPTQSRDKGEDILHLDCSFNPLGLGHALIYPGGLAQIPDILRDRFDWIEVTRTEATAMATNVLSIAPDHIIARTDPSCARVNAALRRAGYTVTEVDFDAVPATGGSFRCATMPLQRGAA